ncbi:MAG TPA: efflux RND transporter periplasmic adaptor subunit [Xanthobacteraceae bacterium]|nr:efflux RND transporter periplasmic adaptor subunit [Xanthobacteraceae bacterium]
MRIQTRAIPAWAVLACVMTGVSACDEPHADQAAAPRPQVSVVTLQPSSRPYIRELPGRIAPTRVAEVRARVAGIVLERSFQQGADVKAGDVLYRIDPVRFQVELDAAEAALAKAQAVHDQAEQQAKRVEKLISGQAASQAQYEIAVATFRQAQADVAARKADVARVRLDLDYTSVRSPINGRIGRALVTEGALVGQGEATHLATVHQLDPVYADFTQSAGDLQQLRRDLESGALEQVEPDAAKVRLVLDDGTLYPLAGKLLFSDASVDPGTGQVTLRGEFPNPRGELLPGMYVRVQIQQGTDGDALAVPQQAVQRNDTGGSEVYVVRPDNRAVIKPMRAGRVVDEQWLVLDGLDPGDRVVVEGFQKFEPGDVVDPVPWQPTQAAADAAELARDRNAR